MRMSFQDPTDEAVTIRATFNDVEVLRKDFAIGEIPAVEYNPPPNTSGVAQLYSVRANEETPLGSCTYWAPDFKGAQMLVAEAKELAEAGKKWQARTKLKAAAEIFEKLAPDSNDVAETYTELWSICFGAKARPANRLRRLQEALYWYEKEIAVYQRTGNLAELGGNLINIGALYGRVGDHRTALKRALAGLAIIREGDDSKDPEAIHAWTHCVGHLLTLGHTRQAEKLITEGLTRFPTSTSRAYLLNYQSQILMDRGKAMTKRAEALKMEAEAILPSGSCPLN